MSRTLERILEDVRSLTEEERERLLNELTNIPSPITTSKATVSGDLFGKYAFVPTSSEEFCRRKVEEIDLEDRRSTS